MADSKPCLRQSRRIMTWSLLVLAASLWLGNALSGGNAGGQPPKEQPPPSPLPTANVKDTVKQLVPVMAPTPPVAVSATRVAFNFVIKPDAPLKDLLPASPRTTGRSGALLVEDLSQVPEVAFQEPLAKTPDALRSTAHTMAKINHLNRKKADGFMEALLRERPDLAGLPMAMGDSCRMKGDRTQFFSQALATIKRARGQGPATVNFTTGLNITNFVPAPTASSLPPSGASGPAPTPVPPPAAATPVEPTQLVLVEGLRSVTGSAVVPVNIDPDAFWEQYAKLCAQEDKANSKLDPSQREQVTLGRIAALTQVCGPDSVAMRKGLVKYLAGTSHAEATRALARLAIFSAEDEVRNPAVEALKVRREKDYTDVLLRGLRYPLPAVAKRATEAMAKLERADLVPELVSFLEEPDPRAPVMKDMGQKKVPIVRELVRINHHRNCLMCHAPAVPNEVSPQVTTAEVPRPDQPLPSPSDGYSNSIPDVLVRLDVTYLRQDFSVMQAVADANPWPEMQRFDFLVRTRVLSDQEATAFPARKAGTLSPYQRVALAALRELTGRDTAPTPEAWRKLLDLPRREARESLETALR
jgi:hypothetical protein